MSIPFRFNNSDALNVDARTRRISADEGHTLTLRGVKEIAWDEVTGLRIVFAPGGSIRAVRELEVKTHG